MFKNFLEQTLNGLQTGSIYALIALGYTMVYGIVKLINFAHGDILMVGAYIAFMCVTNGLGLTSALLIAVLFCIILGILIEKLAYKPLRDASRMNVLITAIGVSFLLESIALIYFGASPKVISLENVPIYLSSDKYVNVLGIDTSYLSLFIIIVSIICMISLYLFIKFTNLGKAMRAVAQDLSAAKLMGINTDFTISITFAIGSALGALGGVMYAFGGIGSIPGAVVGGYLMGLIENYVKGYISSTWANPIVFGILIITLIFRPNGIFGKNMKEKV